MTYLSYPRLDRSRAQKLVGEYQLLTVCDLASYVDLDIAHAAFYPLSIERVSRGRLESTRKVILDVAIRHGFPALQGKGGYVEFDQDVARLLVDLLEIVPSEAMTEDVWSFLSLKVMPDVTAWRFPARLSDDGTQSATWKRWIGDPRNAYRRLWVRGYALGSELAGVLGEDNYVAIFERPTIGGDPRVARRIASWMRDLNRSDERHGGSAQDIMRDAMKRLRRRYGTTALGALSDQQLDDVVNAVFLAAVEATMPQSIA